MSDLFVHLVIIGPVCGWILSNKNFTRPYNFVYAILFLASIALATEYHQSLSRPPNYYRILNVDKSASNVELKRAFKAMSLKLHPDKNPSPDAQVRPTQCVPTCIY